MSDPVARPAPDANQRQIASHILQRLGEGGQPPEVGVELINVGNESYLKVLEHEYFGNQLRIGSSFKLVQGYFGGGKTHFLHCVRDMAWRHGFVTAPTTTRSRSIVRWRGASPCNRASCLGRLLTA